MSWVVPTHGTAKPPGAPVAKVAQSADGESGWSMNNHVLLASLKTIKVDVEAIRRSGNIGEAHSASARADVLLKSLVAILEEEKRVSERYTVQEAQ